MTDKTTSLAALEKAVRDDIRQILKIVGDIFCVIEPKVLESVTEKTDDILAKIAEVRDGLERDANDERIAGIVRKYIKNHLLEGGTAAGGR